MEYRVPCNQAPCISFVFSAFPLLCCFFNRLRFLDCLFDVVSHTHTRTHTRIYIYIYTLHSCSLRCIFPRKCIGAHLLTPRCFVYSLLSGGDENPFASYISTSTPLDSGAAQSPPAGITAPKPTDVPTSISAADKVILRDFGRLLKVTSLLYFSHIMHAPFFFPWA